VPPTAVCQNVTVQLNGAGNASITAADIDGGSNDACGIANLSAAPNTFNCSNVGANTSTLTVVDVNGNTSTCTVTVTVEDNNLPVALCASPTVNLTSDGITTVAASFFDGGSSATCPDGPVPGGSVDFSASMTDFDCDDVGNTYNVTLTVTSQANGQSATCTANVTVADPNSFCCAPPVAVCDDITVQLDANGGASVTPADVGSNSTAECGQASESLDNMDFDCADVGGNTVTYTITDINNDSDNCTATVTIEDKVAPTPLCQNTTVQLDQNGSASIMASDVDNGSNDACGIAGLTVSPSTFGCGDTGSNTVTLTVSDANGNTATCTATVSVEDNMAPTAVCLNTTVAIEADGTYNMAEADVYDATNSSDNCSIATVSFPATTFDCNDLGLTFPILVTVADPSGNVGNCTANVTINLGTDLPNEWASNDIGANPQGTDYSFDPCSNPNPNNGEFTITGSGANGTNPLVDAVAFASQNLCGDFTITTKVESVTPGGYGGIMVRESMAPGSKQFSLFSNLTNVLLVEIRTATNAPKQQQLHNRPFPTWLRVQRMGPWLMSYYSPDGINFQYVQAVFMPTNNCLEVGLAAFTNFGGPSTAVFSNVTVAGGSALAGSGVPSFVQQGEQLPTSDLRVPTSPRLFPNPTTDRFTLAFPQSLNGEATATLRNQIGQVMAQRQLKPGDVTTEWNVSALPSGLYFMEIRQSDAKPKVLRVVKSE
jgi:hypothetical protein